MKIATHCVVRGLSGNIFVSGVHYLKTKWRPRKILKWVFIHFWDEQNLHLAPIAKTGKKMGKTVKMAKTQNIPKLLKLSKCLKTFRTTQIAKIVKTSKTVNMTKTVKIVETDKTAQSCLNCQKSGWKPSERPKNPKLSKPPKLRKWRKLLKWPNLSKRTNPAKNLKLPTRFKTTKTVKMEQKCQFNRNFYSCPNLPKIP